MTWPENMDKGHSDRRNGVNNKMNNSVMQSNIAVEPIKQYHSMMQAQRETGIHSGKICACCKKIRKSAGGYRWEYA